MLQDLDAATYEVGLADASPVLTLGSVTNDVTELRQEQNETCVCFDALHAVLGEIGHHRRSLGLLDEDVVFAVSRKALDICALTTGCPHCDKSPITLDLNLMVLRVVFRWLKLAESNSRGASRVVVRFGLLEANADESYIIRSMIALRINKKLKEIIQEIKTRLDTPEEIEAWDQKEAVYFIKNISESLDLLEK